VLLGRTVAELLIDVVYGAHQIFVGSHRSLPQQSLVTNLNTVNSPSSQSE
jgi:hypothetical protein